MRTLLLVATISALAVGSASAEAPALTVRDVQDAMLKANNKRLALDGVAFRILVVRCIRETTASFYCVGYLSARGGVQAGTRYAWNVSVAAGTIQWDRPHVLLPR